MRLSGSPHRPHVSQGDRRVIDLAFYNAGCHEPKGLKRVVVPFRRLIRRLMRPMFLRQVEILEQLCERLDEQAEATRALHAEMRTVMAFGWDYTALVRRLAVLEDRVEALMVEAEAARTALDADTAECHARVA